MADGKPGAGTRYAALLALGYLSVATLWVVVTDWLARTGRLGAHTAVDAIFAVGSAAGVFFAARQAMARLSAGAAEVARGEHAILLNERRVFTGIIASTIAHDANNMLAVVLAELDDLEGPLDVETAGRVKEAVTRLAQLNRGLVSAGRTERRSSLVRLDLSVALKAAVDMVRHHPSVRDTRLTVQADGPLLVDAQHLLVSQIVTNLVLNAGEATNGRGAIDVRAYTHEGRAVIEVDDDGPGVPPERRKRLFDALETTKAGGNGMGLFSVRAAARGLQGSVSVDTSPGGGARFRVTLPLAETETRVA